MCLDNQRRRLKRQQQQHLWQLDIGQAVRLLSGNLFFGYTALFLHQAVVQVALCVSIQILDSLRDVQVDNNFRLLERMHAARGVPAYTQSTQLRTLIFECPKNKNVLNREKCNKKMPQPG